MPYMKISSIRVLDPLSLSFPAAFGFNNLILDNHTAAFLDAPMQDPVSATQAKPELNEYRDVSASVNATVSGLNDSIVADRNNTDFWNPNWSFTKLQTNSLWNDFDIGLLVNQSNGQDTSICFCEIIPSAAGQGQFIQSDRESQNFMQVALMFSSQRERFSGTWRITKMAI